VRPQWAASLALHALLGVAASVAAVAYAPVGVGLALLLAISLALEAAGRPGLLRLLLPRRATQHVLALPEGARPVTLLICARYDAPRAGALAGERGRRPAARLRRALGGRTLGPRGWLVAALLLVAACAGARLAGVDGLAVGIPQFLATVALLVAFAFAIDVAASPVTAGANAGASAAAVAVALHDELTQRPPARLAPALLLLGAGEGGPQSLRSHLRRERMRAADTVLLEIAASGAGAPSLSERHPQLRSAGEQAAAALGPAAPGHLPRARTRVPGAVVGCLDATGVAPRVRQADDVPAHLDPAALNAALDFALAVVDSLDEDLARR